MKIFASISPSDLPAPDLHALMLSIVIPRPIGLISTISLDGLPNLAPFSYFQAVSAVPPLLLFCPNRNRFGRVKHSLINARDQREFVACMVTEEMAEAVNYASGEFPDGVNEFEEAGFTTLASELVKPFRVAESPIQMECRVREVLEFSDQPLGGSVVVGEILLIHIREDILVSVNSPQISNFKYQISNDYRPISRLGGVAYGLLRQTFDMPRPKMTEDGKVVVGSHKVTRKSSL